MYHLFPEPTYINSTKKVEVSDCPPDLQGKLWQQASCDKLPAYHSQLCILSKCLEKLIFRRLYSHLDPFLPSHQSGFRQKDSMAYQLSRLIHRLASALDEGHTTLACFYDLSKAFDRVWHRSLLANRRFTQRADRRLPPGVTVSVFRCLCFQVLL